MCIGNNSYIKSLSTINRLAEYIKNNIRDGSQLVALETSTLAGFITILIATILEFIYTRSKTHLLQDNQIKIIETDFEIDSEDNYEIITFKKKDIDTSEDLE